MYFKPSHYTVIGWDSPIRSIELNPQPIKVKISRRVSSSDV